MLNHRPYLALVSALECKYDEDFTEITTAFIERMMYRLDDMEMISEEDQIEALNDTWENEIFPKLNASLQDPIEDQADVFLNPILCFGQEFLPEEGLPSPPECERMLEEYLAEWSIEAKVEETQVEETQVEETQVEETQVEETQVEETQVKETQVEETQVEEIDITKINKLAESLNLDATSTGGVINWPWFMMIQKLIQAETDMTNFASIIGQLKESGHIKSRKDLLDSILMAFSGEIGFDAIVAISALFEELE